MVLARPIYYLNCSYLVRPHLISHVRWSTTIEVCDENTEDYKLFNISLGDNPILEPKADLCSAKEFWWSDSACPRAVVNTMAPLLVSKVIARAFLQPIITLLRWGFVETSTAKSFVFSTLDHFSFADDVLKFCFRVLVPQLLQSKRQCHNVLFGLQHARQVANVVSRRWAALHVARSDLHEPILGAGSTSKFVGDLGWSSFAVGSLCACSAAISAFGNGNQHVDVQSGARPLWCGAFGSGQDSDRHVTKVFARQLVCLSVLPELVCLVQRHAWPVAAPADCVDLRT